MNGGTIIICPVCLEDGQKIVLGSINANGLLAVRRFYDKGGTTVIYSEAMTIMHYCGFGTTISMKRPSEYPLT